MSLAKEIAKCPFCREPIAIGAIRCKHCHADLGGKGKPPSFLKRLDTFRTGFLSGLLFMVILIVLAYYQFFAGR